MFPLPKDARMCAAIFNRPDPRPPPPFSTALNINIRVDSQLAAATSRATGADHVRSS
jgi:hypothetical protein